ncbi:uncharacterized protein LOC129749340 [Uranotaenia lowii]|uniref:uncharacterized protein LOC129749340 n=1 Tax=Uranotaenia lowii TaxID=190385 RepID=UPI002478A6EB|nr:uncharacterized protein LOC129749340 [Uranotaenia lowii]
MRDDLLVMEDLNVQGYRSMPHGQDFEQDHMLLVWERMAQMHACSLELEYKQMNGEKLEPKFSTMMSETTFIRENSWFVVGLEGIFKVALKASKYSNKDEYRTAIESTMLDKMSIVYDLVQPTDCYQCVLVHRDLWFSNIMFQFCENSSNTVDFGQPISCVLLDFQMSRYLPPAVDFWCALYLLTRRKHRDRYYETYVNYYYSKLDEKLRLLNLNIASILPKKQFLETLDHYRLVGLLWSGVLLALVKLPEGFMAELHQEDPAAYHEFGMISRDKLIMEFLQKDPYYRDCLLDSVEETVEYLFGFK